MIFIQSVKKDDKWAIVQQDRYTMTVSKLCKRLCERAGIRSEYTSALRKHGSIIVDRGGQIVKLEIKLEEKDGKHEFTGVTRDFTKAADSHDEPAAAEGDQVHDRRGATGSDERSGSAPAGAGEVHPA